MPFALETPKPPGSGRKEGTPNKITVAVVSPLERKPEEVWRKVAE
jgi:hypothetical protein